jgi:MraZ protein
VPKQPSVQEPISFIGHAKHGLDASRRVMLPAKWRPSDPVTFTMLPWPIGKEDRVLVLPPERWREMLTKLKTKSLTDKRVEALEKVIAENAAQVELDKVGRLCLPEELSRIAGITNEAEFVGRLDKFEIWNPSRIEASRAQDRRLAAEVVNEVDL